MSLTLRRVQWQNGVISPVSIPGFTMVCNQIFAAKNASTDMLLWYCARLKRDVSVPRVMCQLKIFLTKSGILLCSRSEVFPARSSRVLEVLESAILEHCSGSHVLRRLLDVVVVLFLSKLRTGMSPDAVAFVLSLVGSKRKLFETFQSLWRKLHQAVCFSLGNLWRFSVFKLEASPMSHRTCKDHS